MTVRDFSSFFCSFAHPCPDKMHEHGFVHGVGGYCDNPFEGRGEAQSINIALTSPPQAFTYCFVAKISRLHPSALHAFGTVPIGCIYDFGNEMLKMIMVMMIIMMMIMMLTTTMMMMMILVRACDIFNFFCQINYHGIRNKVELYSFFIIKLMIWYFFLTSKDTSK